MKEKEKSGIKEFLENSPEYKHLFKKRDKFILDENNNAIPADLMKWAEWLESNHERRIVKQEAVNDCRVSTVFLGLIHSYDERKLDIFETMVFNGKPGQDIYCERYDTWKEAEEGHQRAVEWVKSGCKEDE